MTFSKSVILIDLNNHRLKRARTKAPRARWFSTRASASRKIRVKAWALTIRKGAVASSLTTGYLRRGDERDIVDALRDQNGRWWGKVMPEGGYIRLAPDIVEKIAGSVPIAFKGLADPNDNTIRLA